MLRSYTFCGKKNSSNLHIFLKLTPFRGSAYTIFQNLLLWCKNFWHNIYTLSSNLHHMGKPNLKLRRKSLIPFVKKKIHQIYTFCLSLHFFVEVLAPFLKSYCFCVRIFGITFILFLRTYTFCGSST